MTDIRTAPHYWWQNDQTWTTRDGHSIAVDQLTPSHRTSILGMLGRMDLRLVRHEMLMARLLLGHEDALDDEYEVISDGPAESILDRMPIVRRLRELDEQDAARRALIVAETEARVAQRERERNAARRDARRRTRTASRDVLVSDLQSITLLAAENADQETLVVLRTLIARVLSTSGKASRRGRAEARKLLGRWAENADGF